LPNKLEHANILNFRHKSTPWRFVSPNRSKSHQKACQHFECVSGKPCMQMTHQPVLGSRQNSQMTSLAQQRQSQPKQCAHFICEPGRPCMMTGDNVKTSIVSSTQLNCSPQLQKVVYRAVNNNNDNNYWKPDRSNLKLNLPLNRATLV